MKKENSVILFNQKKVRRIWNDEQELWYFSIVDVVAILTDSRNPRRYWSDLKIKLKQEGSEVYEKIVQLKWPLLTANKDKPIVFLPKIYNSIPLRPDR